MDLRLIPPQRGQVYLLFYKPTSQDPLQNRLVSYFDGPFCHVEMAIPDRYGDDPSQKVMWGSSIYQNEPVFYKQKTYRRDGYVSIAIEVTMQQLQTVRQFCMYHAAQQTPFSVAAMYAAYLPFQLIETDATFCSKHVAHALQAAGISAVEGINPALTTPSLLYRSLVRTAILQVVPSRMVTPQQLQPPASLSLFYQAHPQQTNGSTPLEQKPPAHGAQVTHGNTSHTTPDICQTLRGCDNLNSNNYMHTLFRQQLR